MTTTLLPSPAAAPAPAAPEVTTARTPGPAKGRITVDLRHYSRPELERLTRRCTSEVLLVPAAVEGVLTEADAHLTRGLHP